MFELKNIQLSVPHVLGTIAIIYVTCGIFWKLYINARIRKLGARAPIRKTYVPWGLDMVYDLVRHALEDKTYELWIGMFEQWCGPGGYSIEANIGGRVVLTAEPENIKALLATQFEDFGKGENFRKDWHAFLGNGIFTTDGQLWHDSRRLIRSQFLKDRLSDLQIFEEHIQVLISKIELNKEFDILDLMSRYTLDAATHYLLGRSVGSLEKPQTLLADAFYNAPRVQSLITRLGPLSWLVPRKRMGFYNSINTINDFVSQFIDEALALPPEELKEKTKHDKNYSFLYAIASYTRDRDVIRDQLLSVLVAGRDTTACTLTWIIYHLSIDQAITKRLRQEILTTIGLERSPTYTDLKNMKYLQNVLNETLRLYPVVPYNIRISLKDTTLPTGGGLDGQEPIGILAGTRIGYSTLVMQRREDLYPLTSAHFSPVSAFTPERWDNWTPKSWTYIPFNGGPRICLGQQFALAEMGYTLVRLFQKFETVENRMNGVKPGLRATIVLQPAKDVKVAFR